MEQKIFRIVLSGILLFTLSASYAQDYAETALMFSRTRPGGSARIQAMGGAQVSLGGDYSSALSNPAGLGMFNRSEVTFSLGLSDHNTSANYLGFGSEDSRSVFNVPGLSLVWNMPKDDDDFLGGSFAVTMSRTNDFNRSMLYAAPNDNSSIIDYFIDQATGETTAQFEEDGPHYNTPTGLGYYNYLIGSRAILDPPGAGDEYFTDAGYPENQQEEIIVKGATNQWSISYGGNFKDKLFFGAGIGISSLRYKSEKIFNESFPAGEPLEALQLNEMLNIRGSGINATLGLIVRPIEFLQVGVSYMTPTFYNLAETYEASMSTNWDNFDYYGDGETILNDESAGTDIVTSDYNLTVPSRLNAGITLRSPFGFISGDIELTNPANARYNSDTPGISYSNENDDIKTLYKSVVNYRVGAEFRYEIFRLRAGYAVDANTFNNSFNDNKISSVTGGAGIRTKDFYVDFALVHSQMKDGEYYPYTFRDGSGPVVDFKNSSTTGMITVGFTF